MHVTYMHEMFVLVYQVCACFVTCEKWQTQYNIYMYHKIDATKKHIYT